MSFFKFGPQLSAENPLTRQEGAKQALRLLFAINLLNYADRYVPAAVKEEIEESLGLDDFESSLPNSGMVLVYMLSAVIFGYLSDKELCDRRLILAGGILFWSFATGLAGLSQNLFQLVLFRSLVGVGEAAYTTVAPPMIFDFYPIKDRQTAFGIYYLAIPIGAALGYIFGGVLASFFGWRWAFVACGIPGVIVSCAILGINSPVRGINDPAKSSQHVSVDSGGGGSNPLHGDDSLASGMELSPVAAHGAAANPEHSTLMGPGDAGAEAGARKSISSATYLEELYEVCSNKVYVLCVLGLAANNFALGGLADWATVYLQRHDAAGLAEASLVVGGATVVGGILGTVIGSKLTAYYDGKVKSAYFLVSAVLTIPAALFLFLGLNVQSKAAAYVLFFLFETFIWTCVAPINTLSIHAIPFRLRSTASGFSLLLVHVLGDVISPPLIGLVSDHTGSLTTALQMTWMAVLLSGLYWYLGYLYLPAQPVMSSSTGGSSEGGIGDDSEPPLTYGEIIGCCCDGGAQNRAEHEKN
jgi:MFS transporter, Spinster family, sphingosine-1-phosphate transporter